MDSKKRKDIINFLKMFVSSSYKVVLETMKEGLTIPTTGFSRKQISIADAIIQNLDNAFESAWYESDIKTAVLNVFNTTIKSVDMIYSLCEDKAGSGLYKDKVITTLNKLIEVSNTIFVALDLPKDEALALLMSKMDPSSEKTTEPSEDEEDDNDTSASKVIDKSYMDNITYWWEKFNAIVVVTPYDKNELPHKATAGEFNIKNEDMIIAAANIVADELGYPVKQLTEKLKTVVHIYMPAEACVRNKIMFATITAILSDAAKQHSGRSDDLQTIQTAPLEGLSDDEYAQMLQQDQPIPRDEWLPPIKNILQKCKTQPVYSSGVRKEPIIEGGIPVFSVSDVPAPTTPSKTDGKIVVEDLGCGCQIPDEILKAIVPQSDNEELVKSIPNVEDLSMYVADSIEDISEKSQSCGIGEAVYFVPCASKKIVSEIIPVVAKNKADAIAKIKMLKSDDSCETVGKCYSSADIVKRKEISDVWSTSDEDDNLMSLLSKLNK